MTESSGNPAKDAANGSSPDAEFMRQAWDARAQDDPLYAIDARRRGWKSLDDFYSQGPELVEKIVDPALKMLDVHPSGLRVLEVGCGMGRLFDGLSQRFAEVWGIDISAEMIALGRANCPVQATWLVGDGTSLTGVDDESVDHVLCFEVFGHIPRPSIIESYLGEFQRVLKAGGTFQTQFRSRSDSLRQSIVRALPRPLRVASGAVLGRIGLSPVQGDIDTWLGSLVSPAEGLRMAEAIGFVDIAVYTALLSIPPPRAPGGYWLVGRKSNEVRPGRPAPGP
jgi:SAM-dependent methyltransferase